jgi:hypothetical protein
MHCDGSVVLKFVTSCAKCYLERKEEDHRDIQSDKISGRVDLLDDLRSDIYKIVAIERKSIGNKKQCFLLQKYINSPWDCSYKELALLIDKRLFRHPRTYKFIEEYYIHYQDFPWKRPSKLP